MQRFKLRSVLIGFFAGIAVTTAAVSAVSADSTLKSILVNFDLVKKIVFDGVEKIPPEDMKPFVYNGRTYVSLKYAGEALGKEVGWDPKTGTITIESKAEEAFADALAGEIGDDWKPEDGVTQPNVYTFEPSGENGFVSIPYIGAASGNYLILNKKHYRDIKSYTVEFEFKASGTGKYADYRNTSGRVGMFVGLDYLSPRPDFSNLVAFGYGDRSGTSEGDQKIDMERYHKMKVVRDNGKADIYLDDAFIRTQELVIPGEGSEYIGIYTNAGGNYFRNFKLAVNGKM